MSPLRGHKAASRAVARVGRVASCEGLDPATWSWWWWGGEGAACEKAQEVPRGSWPPPRFLGALTKMEPAVQSRRGGEERGAERGMRGRAGNRLQRGV